MRKAGIDTNVLLRLLINDNAAQHQAVLKFGKGLGKDYSGFVPAICLVEMNWALRQQYGFTKQQSIEAIRRITRIRGLEVQSQDSVERALRGVESGDGEFADLLIVQLCLDVGCDQVVTLDKKAAAKIPIAELLS